MQVGGVTFFKQVGEMEKVGGVVKQAGLELWGVGRGAGVFIRQVWRTFLGRVAGVGDVC